MPKFENDHKNEAANVTANAGSSKGVLKLATANAGANAMTNELGLECHFISFSSHCHTLISHLINTYGIGETFYTNCPAIHQDTSVSCDSVLRILTEFQDLSLLRKQRYRKGRFQGLEIVLLPACNEYLKFRQNHKMGLATAPSAATTEAPSIGSSLISSTTDPEAQKIIALTDDVIEESFPQLSSINFGRDQLAQIVENRLRTGRSLKQIMLALNNAEWALTNGALIDSKGAPVENPLNYLFSVINRVGFYSLPKGLITPDEEAALKAEKQLSDIKMAKKRTVDAKFEIWCSNLNSDERKEILAGHRHGPQNAWLRKHWNNIGAP